MKNILLIKSIIYCISWFLFVNYIFPYADIFIDPCSSTPGHDYSNSIFIILIYCITFYLIGRYYLQNIFVKSGTKNLYIFLIGVIIPLFSLALGFFFVFSINENWLLNMGLREYFYKNGCYGDSELKRFIPNIVGSIILMFVSYLLILLKVNKHN